MTRLVLHVDRLVLRGIDGADPRALAAGLQAELQQLLSAPGAVQALVATGDQARVRGAPVPVPRDAGRQAGQAIATSIAKGVAR